MIGTGIDLLMIHEADSTRASFRNAAADACARLGQPLRFLIVECTRATASRRIGFDARLGGPNGKIACAIVVNVGP